MPKLQVGYSTKFALTSSSIQYATLPCLTLDYVSYFSHFEGQFPSFFSFFLSPPSIILTTAVFSFVLFINGHGIWSLVPSALQYQFEPFLFFALHETYV